MRWAEVNLTLTASRCAHTEARATCTLVPMDKMQRAVAMPMTKRPNEKRNTIRIFLMHLGQRRLGQPSTIRTYRQSLIFASLSIHTGTTRSKASVLHDMLARCYRATCVNPQDISNCNDDVDNDASRALLPGVRQDLPVLLEGQAVRCLSDDCGGARKDGNSAHKPHIMIQRGVSPKP